MDCKHIKGPNSLQVGAELKCHHSHVWDQSFFLDILPFSQHCESEECWAPPIVWTPINYSCLLQSIFLIIILLSGIMRPIF